MSGWSNTTSGLSVSLHEKLDILTSLWVNTRKLFWKIVVFLTQAGNQGLVEAFLTSAHVFKLMGCHCHPITTQRLVFLGSELTNHLTGINHTSRYPHVGILQNQYYWYLIQAPTLGKSRFFSVYTDIYVQGCWHQKPFRGNYLRQQKLQYKECNKS